MKYTFNKPVSVCSEAHKRAFEHLFMYFLVLRVHLTMNATTMYPAAAVIQSIDNDAQ